MKRKNRCQACGKSKIEGIKKKYLDDFDAGNYLVTKCELEYLIKVAEAAEKLSRIIDSASPDILYSKECDALDNALGVDDD